MRFKTARMVGFKAAEDVAGQFEAVVAVFGNVDLGGDRIVKGAFADSLKGWEAKGRPIPVVFSHQWGELDAHIGEVVEAKETDAGLWVRAQLDMDDPSAAKVWRLMKRGTLAEFSFAYDVLEEKLQNGANELLSLDIIEVGPTLKGMNPATELLTVKARDGGTKSTRVAARQPGGGKQAITGSFEERRDRVAEAIRARYGENDRYYVWVVATFDESAVFAVYSEDGTGYRQIDYSVVDGALELGEERDVELQTTIVPKADPKGDDSAGGKSEDRKSGKLEDRPRTVAGLAAFDLLAMGSSFED